MASQTIHIRKSKYGKTFVAGKSISTKELIRLSKKNESLIEELDQRFYSSKRHYMP